MNRDPQLLGIMNAIALGMNAAGYPSFAMVEWPRSDKASLLDDMASWVSMSIEKIENRYTAEFHACWSELSEEDEDYNERMEGIELENRVAKDSLYSVLRGETTRTFENTTEAIVFCTLAMNSIVGAAALIHEQYGGPGLKGLGRKDEAAE